jgi:hypothetical protein
LLNSQPTVSRNRPGLSNHCENGGPDLVRQIRPRIHDLGQSGVYPTTVGGQRGRQVFVVMT